MIRIPVALRRASGRRRIAPLNALQTASIAGVVAAAANLACSNVLGLDAPRLSPCADYRCPEGPPTDAAGSGPPVDGYAPLPDAGDVDSSLDAALDATDAMGEQVTVLPGVRCGPNLVCDRASPICCETVDSTHTAYACIDGSTSCPNAPPTYPILCSGPGTCPPDAPVCCHFHSRMRCVTTVSGLACGMSLQGTIVCDPSDAGAPGDARAPASECPAGSTCSGSVDNLHEPSPYRSCM